MSAVCALMHTPSRARGSWVRDAEGGLEIPQSEATTCDCVAVLPTLERSINERTATSTSRWTLLGAWWSGRDGGEGVVVDGGGL